MILLLKAQVKAYTKRDGTHVGPHFRSAVKFATERHRGQTRKDGKTPYIYHPARVVHILRRAGIDDPATLTAAILHDTVEDTATSYDDVRERFGQEVADLVMEVTKDATLSQTEQKRAEPERARRFTPKAAQIKLADKISNLIDIVQSPPPWPLETRRGYYEHARKVVDSMSHRDPRLLSVFDTVYSEGLSRLS